MKLAVLAAALLLSATETLANFSGSINNLNLTVTFGASAGLDKFEATGAWMPGPGSNGLNLPQDAVMLSFDNGRYVQAIPANSFTPISGGHRYTSTGPGVTLFRIMNNGTFVLEAKNLDLTGTQGTALGSLTFWVGDDSFTGTPNSIPVSRIQGPSDSTINTVVTLDGGSSTDFNPSTNLAFAWTLISQPDGSAVALSSSGSQTTSFTPTHNGAYVVKLVTNDGVADGVPTLHTVQVTGAPDDPETPPGPDNGLIVLGSDAAGYLVGESATLTLNVNVNTGNPANEYFFVTTLNDIPITMIDGGTVADFIHASAAFTAAGQQTFKADVYIQNKALAKALTDGIVWFQANIAAVDAALAKETDPAIVAQLQAQRAADQQEVVRLQGELVRNRTRVMNSAILVFSVN